MNHLFTMTEEERLVLVSGGDFKQENGRSLTFDNILNESICCQTTNSLPWRLLNDMKLVGFDKVQAAGFNDIFFIDIIQISPPSPGLNDPRYSSFRLEMDFYESGSSMLTFGWIKTNYHFRYDSCSILPRPALITALDKACASENTK
jgi:hypothetical protein